MRRERRLVPLQVAEQALQPPQSVKVQSTAASQLSSTLQNAVSRSLPDAGAPHSDADVATFRVRKVTPPPQLLEQGDHSDHSDQAPSTHLGSLQACVLQGATSSRSRSWQGSPPPRGDFLMLRSLVRWPPPQEQLQLLHSVHSFHSQSCLGQARFSWQGTACDRAARQPRPPALRLWSTMRMRFFWPAPQLVEQVSQLDQSESSQSLALQGAAAQPRVCMSSAGQSRPPLAA
mmetsp:Transcript_51455/g.164756  ORF Transcript_51455/g.164756 Transcript_51455/m.164756 type:complete len:232 (-) Transcript_51455:944-1639(-)